MGADAVLMNRAAAVDVQAAEAAAVPEPEASQEAPPEAASAAAAEAAAEQPALSPEQEARALIDVAVASVVPFFPALEEVYTDEAKGKLAAVSAPLMAKYGVTVASLFARWKEEIEFSIVAAPLLIQTLKAIQASRAKNTQPRKSGEPSAGGSNALEPVGSSSSPAGDHGDRQAPLNWT